MSTLFWRFEAVACKTSAKCDHAVEMMVVGWLWHSHCCRVSNWRDGSTWLTRWLHLMTSRLHNAHIDDVIKMRAERPTDWQTSVTFVACFYRNLAPRLTDCFFLHSFIQARPIPINWRMTTDRLGCIAVWKCLLYVRGNNHERYDTIEEINVDSKAEYTA